MLNKILLIAICAVALAIALASSAPGCNPFATLFPPCPSDLQACPPGCIPPNANCCPDGSYCVAPTWCVEGAQGYTCGPGDPQVHSCGDDERRCALSCIPSDQDCCHMDECKPPYAEGDSTGACPTDNGLVFCGYCQRNDTHGDCSGRCRYCLGDSVCRGEICGELECCTDGDCRPQSDCEGASAAAAEDPGCGGGGSGEPCGDEVCSGSEICVSTRNCVVNEVGEGCECSGSADGTCVDFQANDIDISACGTCSAEHSACCAGDSCVNGACDRERCP